VLLLLLGAATSLAAQEPDRSVVAVVRFDNNTGDERYDNLGRAMSSMMISDLSAIERIQLVERERMEEVMAEQNLQYSGRVDEETAVTLGMIVGAQYMVFGSFVTMDPEMRIDTRVTKTETAEIVTTADVRGQNQSLFDLQQQLADTLIAGFELVLTYSEALCLLDYGAYPEAFEAIQRVRSAAPGSQIVGATFELLRQRATDDARDRVSDGVRRGIGGLIGRNVPAPQPARQRPAAC
jgi:TolB-like protein